MSSRSNVVAFPVSSSQALDDLNRRRAAIADEFNHFDRVHDALIAELAATQRALETLRAGALIRRPTPSLL